MRDPYVVTVILNWRTPDMTQRAARAALRAMEGIAGEVIVVDNASGDGSFAQMRTGLAGLDRLRVVQSGRNGGFGAGNNHGIRLGMDAPLEAGRRADLFYILNSDAFPEEGAIAALVQAMAADPRLGMAGSFVHGENGRPHETAFRFPTIAGEFEGAARLGPVSRALRRWRVALTPAEARERPAAVHWLSGASLMLRREMLEEIGLFDEAYFLYYEETDLARRAATAGWGRRYVAESRVMHIGSVSTGMRNWTRTPDYWFASRRRYFCKMHGPLYAAGTTLALLAGGLIWRARRLVQSKPPADPPRFLRDLVRHDGAALLRALTGGGAARKAPAAQGRAVPARQVEDVE